MVITSDTTLPTEAELTTQEIKLSGAALRAGAFHVGKYCENQNNVSLFLFIFIDTIHLNLINLLIVVVI